MFVLRMLTQEETDINIPLIVRGPGIPENATSDAVTSHTDLAPTFLSLAGSSRPGLDGKRIPTTIAAGNADNRTEHVAIEYWGWVSSHYYTLLSGRVYTNPHRPSPKESTATTATEASSRAMDTAIIHTKLYDLSLRNIASTTPSGARTNRNSTI